MTHEQQFLLSVIGSGVLALLAAASLLFFRSTGEQEISRRIIGLRQGSAVARPVSARLGPALLSLARNLGNTMRGRMLSDRDTGALSKTLTAAGLQSSKALPIFVGAKIVCLLGVPALVWLVTVFLGYPISKQALYAVPSMVVAMMLPNWVVALIRRPYQQVLRRGIPDALDLLVVCAEAGLGLESAVDRVAHEMRQSNKPVGIEFSLLTDELRILPDRRIALNNLAERTGQPALRRLAGTIAQTLKYGTPLSSGTAEPCGRDAQ